MKKITTKFTKKARGSRFFKIQLCEPCDNPCELCG